MVNYTIPDGVSDDVAETVRNAVQNVEELTIEDRTYRLSEDEFADDADVQRDRDDLPYVVDGEQPMFDEGAVTLDDSGDLWLSFHWSCRRGHYKDRDFAGDAYDAMELAGVVRPNGPENRDAGVQFGTGGNILVENVIRNVGGENE